MTSTPTLNTRRDRQPWLWGPFSALGLTTALLVLVSDQAHKWWMLGPYEIATRGRVAVLPFLDLVYVKNLGVSYGLFLQDGKWGQWSLAGFAAVAAGAMVVWLARGIASKLVAASVGGVADFFSLHAFGFYWYVFNIADVAIVAGVMGLLYDSLRPSRNNAAKPT